MQLETIQIFSDHSGDIQTSGSSIVCISMAATPTAESIEYTDPMFMLDPSDPYDITLVYHSKSGSHVETGSRKFLNYVKILPLRSFDPNTTDISDNVRDAVTHIDHIVRVRAGVIGTTADTTLLLAAACSYLPEEYTFDYHIGGGNFGIPNYNPKYPSTSAKFNILHAKYKMEIIDGTAFGIDTFQGESRKTFVGILDNSEDITGRKFKSIPIADKKKRNITETAKAHNEALRKNAHPYYKYDVEGMISQNTNSCKWNKFRGMHLFENTSPPQMITNTETQKGPRKPMKLSNGDILMEIGYACKPPFAAYASGHATDVHNVVFTDVHIKTQENPAVNGDGNFVLHTATITVTYFVNMSTMKSISREHENILPDDTTQKIAETRSDLATAAFDGPLLFGGAFHPENVIFVPTPNNKNKETPITYGSHTLGHSFNARMHITYPFAIGRRTTATMDVNVNANAKRKTDNSNNPNPKKRRIDDTNPNVLGWIAQVKIDVTIAVGKDKSVYFVPAIAKRTYRDAHNINGLPLTTVKYEPNTLLGSEYHESLYVNIWDALAEIRGSHPLYAMLASVVIGLANVYEQSDYASVSYVRLRKGEDLTPRRPRDAMVIIRYSTAAGASTEQERINYVYMGSPAAIVEGRKKKVLKNVDYQLLVAEVHNNGDILPYMDLSVQMATNDDNDNQMGGPRRERSDTLMHPMIPVSDEELNKTRLQFRSKLLTPPGDAEASQGNANTHVDLKNSTVRCRAIMLAPDQVTFQPTDIYIPVQAAIDLLDTVGFPRSTALMLTDIVVYTLITPELGFVPQTVKLAIHHIRSAWECLLYAMVRETNMEDRGDERAARTEYIVDSIGVAVLKVISNCIDVILDSGQSDYNMDLNEKGQLLLVWYEISNSPFAVKSSISNRLARTIPPPFTTNLVNTMKRALDTGTQNDYKKIDAYVNRPKR